METRKAMSNIECAGNSDLSGNREANVVRTSEAIGDMWPTRKNVLRIRDNYEDTFFGYTFFFAFLQNIFYPVYAYAQI